MKHFVIFLLALGCESLAFCDSSKEPYTASFGTGLSVSSATSLTDVVVVFTLHCKNGELTVKCVHGSELRIFRNALYVIDHFDHRQDKLWEVLIKDGDVYFYNVTSQLPLNSNDEDDWFKLSFHEINGDNKLSIGIHIVFFETKKQNRARVNFESALSTIKPKIHKCSGFLLWDDDEGEP